MWRHSATVDEAEGNVMERGYTRKTASFFIAPTNNSVVAWDARLSNEWISGRLVISLQDDDDIIKTIELVSPSEELEMVRDASEYLPSGRYFLVIYSEGYDWTVTLATAPKIIPDSLQIQLEGFDIIDVWQGYNDGPSSTFPTEFFTIQTSDAIIIWEAAEVDGSGLFGITLIDEGGKRVSISDMEFTGSKPIPSGTYRLGSASYGVDWTIIVARPQI